jgi:poly(hydroxyalkanoate) depolymerase family esterase
MNDRADAERVVVVYPAQSRAANSSLCWNWFQPADQQRELGEPAIIAGITRSVLERYGLDTHRVYIAGLSAGGAMAAVVAHLYPELFAALAVHSGLAYQSASSATAAFAAMSRGGPRVMPRRVSEVTRAIGPIVPTIVFHGDRDSTVHPSNAEHIIAEASARAARLPGGALRALPAESITGGARVATRTQYINGAGAVQLEKWIVHGAGHAWFGGRAGGSYADPSAPDATGEMLRFFKAR